MATSNADEYMNATARGANVHDLPALVNLMAEFYAEADVPLDRAWARASFSTFLANSALGNVWLLYLADEPAGYVVLTVRFSMEYGGLDAWIDDLFVRPAQRRRGLGRLALQAAFTECRRRGVLAVHVEVGRDNVAAKALYASYGLAQGPDDRQVLIVRL